MLSPQFSDSWHRQPASFNSQLQPSERQACSSMTTHISCMASNAHELACSEPLGSCVTVSINALLCYRWAQTGMPAGGGRGRMTRRGSLTATRTTRVQGCAPCCLLLLKERAVMRPCQSLMVKTTSKQQGRLPVQLRWVRALDAVLCYA